MDNRKETAEKIITALTNRSGFNDLWYNLDEDIQTEITDEIVNILHIHDVMHCEVCNDTHDVRVICKDCITDECNDRV